MSFHTQENDFTIATGGSGRRHLDRARTRRGYEMVMKAKILHADPGRVEFMYDIDLPPKKYLIALHARGGRGNDHKVVVCRHEVSA